VELKLPGNNVHVMMSSWLHILGDKLKQYRECSFSNYDIVGMLAKPLFVVMYLILPIYVH